MAWYNTGTIALTNGSATITGSGTNFLVGAQIGEALYAPDGKLYEIQTINSATVITLASNYLGSTASGQGYQIIPTQSLVADLASDVTDLISDFANVRDYAGNGKFNDGAVGTPGITFTQDQDNGLYRIGSNNWALAAGGQKIVDISTSGIGVTGAGTFSGSVALAGSSGGLLLNNSATAENTIQLITTGGTTYVGANGSAGNRFTGSSAYASTFGTTAANALELATNNTVRMTIASTGAATFSGNVTAGGLIVSNASGGNVASFTNTSDADISINLTSGVSLITPSTGILAFGTSSTERMRILADGSVCQGNTVSLVASNYSNQAGAAWHKPDGHYEIATTGNRSALEIGKNNANDGSLVVFRKQGTSVGSIDTVNSNMYLGTGDTGLYFNAGDNTVMPINVTTGAGRDAGINLGKSDTRFKDLYLSGNAHADNFVGTNDTDTFVSMSGSNIMRFYTGGAEAARLDASGNLLVGTTTSGDGVNYGADGITTIKGEYGAMIKSTGGSGYEALSLWNTATSGTIYQAIFRDGASGATRGTITTNGSATAYNTTSDQRLKENIADADDAGSKIDSIQVRKFDWKADGSHQDYGMVAQELLEVVPEAVSGDAESEEMMGVDYSKLVPMMLKEIQSLRARIAALES